MVQSVRSWPDNFLASALDKHIALALLMNNEYIIITKTRLLMSAASAQICVAARVFKWHLLPAWGRFL